MWILKNSKGDVYYLTTEKEHIVSRRDGDLILENDQSISRRHAVVSITYNSQHLADITHQPVVAVMDTNSKYGTFISDGTSDLRKLTSNVRQTLQNGFCIRFGLQWNEWKLQHLPLVITTSTLTPEEKRMVQKDILTLGGHVVNSWIPDVTHVVMSRITLTVKVVCALAYGKPIVTPQYWQSYVASISSRKELPDYHEYLPPLAETTLNINEVSFDINENRRTLFTGKRFFFSTQRQFNSYACMVNAAGGSAEILNLSNYPKEYYFNPDCIVLQYASDRRSQESQVPNEFEDLTRQLKEQGKRVIPESEIALAVLFCSLEKHCNPEFNAASSLVSSKAEVNETGSNLLAMDTQESMPPSLHFETKIIPDSGVVPTPVLSGKQSSNKNIQDSISAGSSKQSCITDYIESKRADNALLRASDLESKNLQQDKSRENIRKIPAMENQIVNTVKMEQMSPASDDACKRLGNFTSNMNKKRAGEENSDIQCITKKLRGNNSSESVASSYLGKPDIKKTVDSNKNRGSSIMLGSKDLNKMGKTVETQSNMLKEEIHTEIDRHGVKRKCTFNDDNGEHSSKRQSTADFDYNNCSTVPVKEHFSSISLKGFINADEEKKKVTITSRNDAMVDATTEELEDMTLIEFKDLVARKDDDSSVRNTFTEQVNQSFTNFKKFRKIRSLSKQTVPVELDTQYNNMNDVREIPNEFLIDTTHQQVEADNGRNGDGSGDSVEGANGNNDDEDWFFAESTWRVNQTRSVN